MTEEHDWFSALEAWASHVLDVVKDRRIPCAEEIEDGEVILGHVRAALERRPRPGAGPAAAGEEG